MQGFWGEVNVFLRESWELFYWSLWWPSKLEGRIGNLNPQLERRIGYLGKFSKLRPGLGFSLQIFFQFIFLIICLSIPIAALIIQRGQPIGGLILVGTGIVITSYGVAIWFFQIGISIPIVSAILYSQLSIVNGVVSSNNYGEPGSIATVLIALSSLPFIGAGIMEGLDAGFDISGIRNYDYNNKGNIFDLFLRILFPFFCGSVGSLLSFAVVFNILLIMWGTSGTPGILLVFISILASISLAPARSKLLGIWIAAIMISLSFEKSGWSSLYVIPTIALTYYRILPDTLIYSVPALSFITPKWLNLDRFSPLFLNKVDNFGGELSWLPIPYHAEILANAFHTNPIATLPEIQRIRSLTLPGYQITTRKLLPLLVADQLNAPKISSEAIQITQKDHPFLPALIPQFYDEETIAKASGSPEVDLMLPPPKRSQPTSPTPSTPARSPFENADSIALSKTCKTSKPTSPPSDSKPPPSNAGPP